jgi:hypothetical protein
MNRRFLTALPLGAGLLAAVACGPSSGSPAAAPGEFSAAATSAQVKAAAADAQALIGKCQPKGTSVTAWEVDWALHPSKTVTSFTACEDVPAAQRQPLLICVVGAAKAASAAPGARAAKEAAFINTAAACTRLAQGTAPSPSPAAS